jgi:putative membrane protein
LLTSTTQWLQGVIQHRGSVLPKILPRVLFLAGFGVIITLIHFYLLPIKQSGLADIVPSVVLGLLLVFRTNTAYERFWEGRKLWGSIVNTSRNLARKIWIFVEESTPNDRHQKTAILRLLVAFAITTKLHLRQEQTREEIKNLLPEHQYLKLQSVNHIPLEIIFWVNDYLNAQLQENKINSHQMSLMVQLLNTLVDSLGACERILKTPMPLAYSIHLKQLLLLYCLIIPFEVVNTMGWVTPMITALTSFTLLGIEEIGLEIENPFGRDPNDLPLDTLCQGLQNYIEDLIHSSPSSCHWNDPLQSIDS